ncbi:MAG: isoprenylcysteine carboxylmethyltransferase family protein [Bacteroidales bacterium]|nr:isoprenylcysteine carboxylmethyltransferase family protein [Bacteroidales bacterium]
MDISFFTTLRPTLVGAWMPAVWMVLVQFICMALFKEGGKRAVDTSWYDARTRRYAQRNTVFQVALIVLAVFVPFRCGTAWFTVGAVIYLVAFALFLWSFHSYGTADRDRLITKGIYRYSRNPMYAVFTLAMLGVVIATASLWLLLMLVPYCWAMHGTILGEEAYCERTYGDDYRRYKSQVPRYMLFF